MKLSKTSLMELSHKYSSILRKCAYLNAIAIMSVAFGANAADYQGGITISENTLYQNQSLSNLDFTQASVTSRSGNKSFGGYAFVDRPYTLTVKDSEYSGLTFDGSGTVFSTRIPLGTDVASLDVSGTTFQNNHTIYDGGAIANYGNLTITDTTFSGNTADYTGSEYETPVSDSNPIGGGAIALGSSSTSAINSSITNTTFTNNRSGTNGGAIGTRLGSSGDNHLATLDIDASFTGNKAYGNGGAIYNTFYANNGLGKGDGVTVKGTFTSNEAKNGGAIYNDGSEDKAGNNGGVMTVSDSTFTGNKATTGYAGAIYNSGASTITIKDSTFNENTAVIAGAMTSGTKTINTYIENTTFEGNSANEVGAVALYSKATLKNVKFINNKATFYDGQSTEYADLVATNTDGAGALFLGAVSSTDVNGVLSDSLFSGNSSVINGGAIATRRNQSKASLNDNSAAKLDISNTTFTNNTAGTMGGAIDNYFYNSNTNTGYATIKGSEFTLNKASEGGAIYNHSEADTKGGYGKILIADSKFIGNTATTKGGAIYNAGDLILSGSNVFSGNKANGGLNDIYNDGTLNVSGNLTLDGGIAGDGDINFADGTAITANLKTTTIIANNATFAGNSTVDFLVANNQANEAGIDFITVTDELTGAPTIQENELYNLSWNTDVDGKLRVNATVKSGSELLKDTPATEQEANTISAIANTAGKGTAAGNTIAERISAAMQTGNKGAAVQAAKDLAPTTSQTIVGVAQSVNSVLSNVAGGRMAAVGRSTGDTFVGGALWAQGLYNHTKQDSSSSTEGFKANTRGISFGIDGKITKDLMIGFGYGYTDTDADAGSHDIDVEGHNFFIYSEYKPSNWYINGMFTYGLSKYDEEKSPMGVGLSAEYDVDTYAANLMTGYDFDNGLTPEVGLRYLLTDQESYNDGVQDISSEETDVLTGVAAIKYHQTYKAKDWTFKPNLRLGATYDMISDNSKSSVNVIGGSSYQITGKRLERFGIETGIGVEATLKDWNFSLDYNGGFRQDYQSHTGMLKAKYNF